MKFSNGCWLQKEGCACFSPAEVYFTKIEKDKVVLCAPTHKINHRGDTLGGINLTVEITTPMPEVIRVKTYHLRWHQLLSVWEDLMQNWLLPKRTGP